MITRNFGIPVTSPGAILRRERDLGTPLGEETAEVLQSGGLVSDKIIIELIEDWLRLHGGHGFVFDGFPSAQFANRAVCPYCDGPLVRRNDDDLGVLQTRLQEFRSKTEPLASFYKELSILRRTDGNRDREAVFSDISQLIEDKSST